MKWVYNQANHNDAIRLKLLVWDIYSVYGYVPSSAQFLCNIWLCWLTLQSTSNMVCAFYQYGWAASYGCATYCLHFFASPMVAVPQKNMVASPNMLALLSFAYYQYGCAFYWYGCATSYVAPPIVCISWHCLWLRLQKIWMHHLIYGCAA